ncbi:hypothetical protein [Actinomyces sp. MRS3W]|uniref:hypothetical protein n=1 Tax=Actinomyces sp. MRS3W TaxID=2800796 RepID=UPI0028FD2566|nr:hypothetical protein [Actinomyces sp. MRS3W]MDU0349284.1 hypothetical protein [Actinomyces sp. MRS3W]
MTDRPIGESHAGPVSVGHLHQALRVALLSAGLACMVGSAISPWYIWFKSSYFSDMEILSLARLLLAVPERLGPSRMYATVGVLLTISLWLCALVRVGADNERADVGMALLTALAVLTLIACHAALSNAINATAGAGLPFMLLAATCSGVCAVKLRR